MSSRRSNNNKKLILIVTTGFIFLLASLWVGLKLVSEPQNIIRKAAYPVCPGGEQCPMAGYSNHLLSCHPGEPDGSPTDSLCDRAGRIETCGTASKTYCCPAANAAWTTDMTKCPVCNAKAPTGLMATEILSTSVTLKWTVGTGAKYRLWVSKDPDPTSSCSSNPSRCVANDVAIQTEATQYILSNLTPNTKYYWRMMAWSFSGCDSGTADYNFTTTSNVATPSPVPSPSPTANTITCSSFSDNFSASTLDTSKWNTWSSNVGSSFGLTGGKLTFYNTQASSSTNNSQSISAKAGLTGDFRSEVVLGSQSTLGNKLDSAIGLYVVNSDWTQFVSVFKYYGKDPGELIVDWTEGSVSHRYSINDGISSTTPVKVMVERIGGSVGVFYDKLDGQGYRMLKKVSNFYTGSMLADVVLSSWPPDFPQTSAYVDDFSLTCGVPITATVLPWDVNQDGTVNIIDIGLIIDNYGKSVSNDPRTDVNSDGIINILDIGIIIDHYGL